VTLALTFTEAPIERLEYLRGKDAEIRALANDAKAQFLPMWNDLHPMDGETNPMIFGPDLLTRFSGDLVFLGLANDIP